MPDGAYNPLDYKNLTASVVRELMSQEPVPLPLPERFGGPGVYALFYNGALPWYAAVRSPEWEEPIYVGKAVLPGGRRGTVEPNMGSPALYRRIGEHVASIEAAENLSLEDFRCRYLVVVPLWITMAERFLIEHYRPVWNVCVDGFGNHDPGAGRHQGEISWWDALHPGRAWAARLRQNKTQQDAIEMLQHHLRVEERLDPPPE